MGTIFHMEMRTHGSLTTFNVEAVLLQNIHNSEYYNRRIKGQCSFEDTVDEIFETVDHVEPWMSGNARGPSTAFCLLYHYFTLNLQPVQIKMLLDHKDSPYIRAIGFLYLRYVCNPREMWHWFEPYLKDSEKFNPSPVGTPGMKEVTVGNFARDIVLTHNYFETLLPRFPEPLKRDWIKKLGNIGLPTKSLGNAAQGGADRRGMDEPNKRPASVKASLSVGFKQRAPNRKNAFETAEARVCEGKDVRSFHPNHAKQECASNINYSLDASREIERKNIHKNNLFKREKRGFY